MTSVSVKAALQNLVICVIDFFSRLFSRRVLGTALAVIIPVMNRVNNWGLSDAESAIIVGALLTYVVADTVEATKKAEVAGNVVTISQG
jgi:hypothetical protein